MNDYIMWEVNYISCEGNYRWFLAKTKDDCTVDDLYDMIEIDDDIAEIKDIFVADHFDENDVYNDYTVIN